MRVTIHTGPKGGVEYRLHDDERGTFRCVGRYAALPYMDEATRAQAAAAEQARKAARKAASDNDAAWRQIVRGG